MGKESSCDRVGMGQESSYDRVGKGQESSYDQVGKGQESSPYDRAGTGGRNHPMIRLAQAGIILWSGWHGAGIIL